MTSLNGKVALITGGSKGIGKATAQTLARLGAFVVVNYSSDSKAADALVAELGQNSLAIQADAGTIEGAEQMVKATIEKFGKIDILIANAALLLMKNVSNTTEEDFDRCMTINVKGPYFLAQKASPHMGPGSHIVFLSSTICHASIVSPDYLLYCTTKGAIEQMTKVLSKDLSRKEISVNAIAPGPTATELFMKGKTDAEVQVMASASPRKRLGKPEEIADVIAWLCSAQSLWVSGQVIAANGGMASIG